MNSSGILRPTIFIISQTHDHTKISETSLFFFKPIYSTILGTSTDINTSKTSERRHCRSSDASSKCRGLQDVADKPEVLYVVFLVQIQGNGSHVTISIEKRSCPSAKSRSRTWAPLRSACILWRSHLLQDFSRTWMAIYITSIKIRSRNNFWDHMKKWQRIHKRKFGLVDPNLSVPLLEDKFQWETTSRALVPSRSTSKTADHYYNL